MVRHLCDTYYDDFMCLDSDVVFEDLGIGCVDVPISMNTYNLAERIYKLLHLTITKISVPPEIRFYFYFYFNGHWDQKIISNICTAYKMLVDAGITDEQLSNYTIRLNGKMHIVCKTPIPKATLTWAELFQKCIHYSLLHPDEIERI